MKVSHFGQIQPICPVCRLAERAPSPLVVDRVFQGDPEEITSGIIHCQHDGCRMEYPIIDGIPVIHSNVRGQINSYLLHLVGREDLPSEIESLISDAAGPGSAYDSMKQTMSSYVWDHYENQKEGYTGSEQPAEGIESKHRPGSASRCLNQAFDLLQRQPEGLSLDLGCAAGGTTFTLADKMPGLVLGVDLNFSLLRVAARVLREGRVVYPMRQGGVVYERREFSVTPQGGDRIDFWCCDALCLPFRAGTLAAVSALNVLDCVSSPLKLLQEVELLLGTDGVLAVSCPYDWSPTATPVESWLGGHSQRGFEQGDSAKILEAILTPEALPASLERLKMIDSRPNIPWSVRVHSRSYAEYRVHLLLARKT